MVNISNQQDNLKAKFDSLRQSKITVKADTFKDKISDERELGIKVLFSDKTSEEDLKVKANVFRDKISDPTTLQLRTIISDKNSEDDIKVKADTFKNKISTFSSDKVSINSKLTNIKTSKVDAANVSFKIFSDNKAIVQEKQEAKTPDYVKDNFEKAKQEIKQDINTNDTKPLGQTVILDSQSLLSLNESLSGVEKLKLLSTLGLKEIDAIIGKVTEGKGLSLNELAKLKQFSELVIDNADKIGVDKTVFVNLNKLVTGVQVSTEKFQEKRAEFDKNAQVVNQKLDKLVEALSDPKLKLDSNFVEMLSIMRNRYKGILASSNPALIAMFSAYIDKVIQTVQDVKDGKQNDPSIFRKMHADYDKFVDNLLKSIGQNKVPSKEELRAYMGELADSFYDMVQTDILPSVKNTGSSGESQAQGQEPPAISKIRSMIKMSNEEISAMSKVSLVSVRKAMSIPSVSTAMADMSSSLKLLKTSFVEVSNAKKELEEATKNLVKLLNSSDFKKSMTDVSAASELTSRNIADEIREAIEKAELLESQLDLEIDSSDSVTIIDLLEKFRSILSQLDEDLKQVRTEEEAAKMIDINYLKSVKENKDRQSFLDQNRTDSLKGSVIQAQKRFAVN